MSNKLFIVLCGAIILLLIGMAALLDNVHQPRRDACIRAGYEWSSIKYVCVVNIKPN